MLRAGRRSTSTGRTACHRLPFKPVARRAARVRLKVSIRESRYDSGAFTRRSRTVPTPYIAPSTAFTSSSTAAAESYSPFKWAVTTS